MSCNEELKANYRINNKREFTKVIKAMIAARSKTIDTINTFVKEYKGKTCNRTTVDWTLVKECCPTRYDRFEGRSVPAIDLQDWGTRRLIECAIKRVAKLAKTTKNNLRVDDMTIDFEGQSFSIDVGNENHAVARFMEQDAVQAFWEALKGVKWQARKGKDGGYCQYNCEYLDSPNYLNYFGRIGDDMKDWVCARPF